VVRARIHIGVRHAKILTHVGSDPVSWVLHAHWYSVSFVLARAWHIQVCRAYAQAHTERKLSFLRARHACIYIFARIREVKVTRDPILRPWNAHRMRVIALFLLNCPDFLVLLAVNGGTASSLRCHWESAVTIRHRALYLCK